MTKEACKLLIYIAVTSYKFSFEPSLGKRPGLEIVSNAYDAADGCDAVVIVTEWREFRTPDWDKLRTLLKTSVLFDGRNLFSPKSVSAQNFEYHAIGLRKLSIKN